MHICFLTNEYPKAGFPHGGLGSFVKTMTEALVQKEIQVTVLGLNYIEIYEQTEENNVTIIRLKRNNLKGAAWYFNSKAIAKALKELHAKNPITILEGAELTFAFLPKIKGVKYVIRLHGGHHFFAEAENRAINWWKGFQEKRSFKKADAFIAVSEYVKNHTANYLSYHNKPIKVIFNPINSQLFQPQAIAIDCNNVTFAGTICEKKGVRHLIQAFSYIKKKFPNVILHLYGRDWKFPDGSSYVKMLQEKELPKLGTIASDVVFHGAVSFQEIPDAYAKAAVCVFPSHMETLGLVAPEAMSMEKAVVFTAFGPGPEVITHNETGLLCNPFKPEDIASKVCWVLENEEKAIEMAKKGRKKVLEMFDISILVEKNIQFYNQFLK